MSELWNKTKNQLLLSDLVIASTFIARGVGLLKYKKLEINQGLWLHDCNSIHTCFMNFAIDCIFVDRNLKIKSLHSEIKPWRLVLPQWGANSVFEVTSGFISSHQLSKGDQLYVVS